MTNGNLDLEYLCTIIGNMAGVPIRLYQNKVQIFYHSIVTLPKDPILLHQNDILAIGEPIGYYISPDFDYYGIANIDNNTIIIGPARLTAPTLQQLNKMAFDLEVAPTEVELFLSSMKVIIHMPLESILQILCTIYYVITRKKISLEDLSIIDSAERISTSNYDTEVHNTYPMEQKLLDMVRRGDSQGLKEWMQLAPVVTGGTVAGDILRQHKNTFIISTTLVSRAAIRGGMDVEEAFRLSDSYIQKCEQLHSVSHIQNLQYQMVTHYTQEVEELRYRRNQTELVSSVSSYIRQHLSEAIKTEDIAKALYISRSHLSTRFKAESGINLTEYIHYIKISEAKHLLLHTDKSLLLISNYLGYSSQSHFTRIFRQLTKVTPAEYRERGH